MTDTYVEKDQALDHAVGPATEKLIHATDASHPSEGDVAIQN